MVGRVLYAWVEDALIGAFYESDGHVDFAYDDSYTGCPISLSLPTSGGWELGVPGRFLESRLPEGKGNLRAMERALGADGESPFDLLPLTDAVGGVSFTETELPPSMTPLPLEPCTITELEAHIHDLARQSNESWWPEAKPHARFSLAGSQGKFSLAYADGRWYWPSGSMPSTHILKPASPRFRESAFIESVSMDLASRAGAAVASHGMMTFGDESCYVTERFDRDSSVVPARRLRTEELFYSLGLADEDKYGIEVREAVQLMRGVGLPEETIYCWAGQVMANMSVGNCDAHMRNYSVYLDEDMAMTPLYDVLCTMYWPNLDNAFSIMINEQCMACGDFTPADWEAEGRACGLDADRLSHMAVSIARNAVDSLETVLPALSARAADRFAACVISANRGMLGRGGGAASDVGARCLTVLPGIEGAEIATEEAIDLDRSELAGGGPKNCDQRV